MKINNGIVILDKFIDGYSPLTESIRYRESNGTEVIIPIQLVLRLYEGLKDYKERQGINWEEYSKGLFREENQ